MMAWTVTHSVAKVRFLLSHHAPAGMFILFFKFWRMRQSVGQFERNHESTFVKI